jgi:hypothetical protein
MGELHRFLLLAVEGIGLSPTDGDDRLSCGIDGHVERVVTALEGGEFLAVRGEDGHPELWSRRGSLRR